MICKNREVIRAWAAGQPARNHRNTLRTDGHKLFSYELQIGDSSGEDKYVKCFTASGRYGFRSQTTSCHVGLALQSKDVVEV